MSELLPSALPIARGTVPVLEGLRCPRAELRQYYGPAEVARFRYVTQVTAAISVEPLHDHPVDSWSALITTADETIQAGIASYDGPHDISRDSANTATNGIVVDGRAGIAQIIAFLRVIPKLRFTEDLANPSSDIATTARRSKPLMVRWSKLDDKTDADLTYAVAYPKPDLSKDDKLAYEDLQFHHKWFELRSNDSVAMRAEKMSHLRDDEAKRITPQKHSLAIMGCPAHELVPRLFDALVQSAESNGLFEQDYRQLRQNHGYAIDN